MYRSLKRKYPKPEKVVYEEPLNAIVYAIISENMSEADAQATSKKFAEYFVDLNDLRVSRAEEVVEVLGADTPVTRGIASSISKVLNTVFAKYNLVTLEPLKKMSKRPARQTLEKMDGTTPFVVDYCMLTSLHGHAIPLTKKMMEYMLSNRLVYPEANAQEIEGFLARQISAENAYEFYFLLRRQSESGNGGEKKKTVRKKEQK